MAEGTIFGTYRNTLELARTYNADFKGREKAILSLDSNPTLSVAQLSQAVEQILIIDSLTLRIQDTPAEIVEMACILPTKGAEYLVEPCNQIPVAEVKK